MSDNSAVVNLKAVYTKEYKSLILEHNVLLKVHLKTVNDYADKCMAYDELKRLLKEAQQECRMVQESLDQCERDLLESKGSVQELLDSIIKEGDSFDSEGEDV